MTQYIRIPRRTIRGRTIRGRLEVVKVHSANDLTQSVQLWAVWIGTDTRLFPLNFTANSRTYSEYIWLWTDESHHRFPEILKRAALVRLTGRSTIKRGRLLREAQLRPASAKLRTIIT